MTVRARSSAAAALRLLVAGVAGFTLSLAFPPRGWGWVAPLAVAALSVTLWRRSGWAGALLGTVFGLAFYLPLIDWMRVVGDDAWVLLSLLCVVWMALTGAGVALVTRLPLWPVWAAAVWVGGEALRTRIPWGGFAWGRLGFSQPDTPLAFLATVGGAPLVTFAVALTGSLLAVAALRVAPALAGVPRWGSEPTRSPGLAGLAVVGAAAVLLASLAASGKPVLRTPGTESDVTAAVVQGSVPGPGLGAQGAPGAVLDNHVRVTEELADEVSSGAKPAPEFVIWPENASDSDPARNPFIAAAITRAVDAVGVPTLVGSVIDNPADPATVLNAGIVWTPGAGPGAQYAKRHPVPFGEYIPLRSILSRFIDRFALIPKDFAAGTEPGVLTLGPARVGGVICFEVADDAVVRDAIVGGGRLLVVQTNNATYGFTGQPDQQLAITRLRAIEHGRTTLVAATSGVSAIITPRGEVVQQLPEFVPGTLVATVTQTDALTLSDRLGGLPELVISLVGLAAFLLAATTRRLGSRRRSSREEAHARD